MLSQVALSNLRVQSPAIPELHQAGDAARAITVPGGPASAHHAAELSPARGTDDAAVEKSANGVDGVNSTRGMCFRQPPGSDGLSGPRATM